MKYFNENYYYILNYYLYLCIKFKKWLKIIFKNLFNKIIIENNFSDSSAKK